MATADTPHGPRFPWVALALCVACVGAAAWTWMRYSYAWDMTPKDLCDSDDPRTWEFPPHQVLLATGRYARLRGVLARVEQLGPQLSEIWIGDPEDNQVVVTVYSDEVRIPDAGSPILVYGRVIKSPIGLYLSVDPDASRFTGASIAGLVVGAMGVFVLTAALRHWRRQRRLHDEQAAEAAS